MNQPAGRETTRRTITRVATGLLAAVLSLGWFLAAPAAADNLTVTLDSPVEGRRYERSTVVVEGQVHSALLTNVDRVQVIVTRLIDDFTLFVENACEPCGRESSIPFSWQSPTLAYNGPYSVRVVASGHLLVNGIRVADASAERSFTVAVRPAAPTNLKAEKLADNKVQLTWGAVPAYPDLLGYLVYRGAPGAALRPVKSTKPGETSYVDERTVGGGTFQYRVDSVRSGAVPGDDSQWLLSESNLATVNVPPPPTTTTGISLPPGSPAPGTPEAEAADEGGAASIDLSQFFSSAASDISLPPPALPTPTITLPDTGFSPNLPFGSAAEGLQMPAQSGRPGTTAADRDEAVTSSVSSEDEEANRRALLVPVAAGSVLCVAALHLRWLSRRLAVNPLGAELGADLEPADPGLEADGDLDGPEGDRQPVGAGAGARPTSGPTPR